jgi:hypothetical protein
MAGDDVQGQSALSAALEAIEGCETAAELVKISSQLADIFINNEVALEYLKEQAVLALHRMDKRRPEMSLDLFRKVMRGMDAEA